MLIGPDSALQIGSSVTDTASFAFPSGLFLLNAGVINGLGTLTNAAGGFLTVAGSNGGSLLCPTQNEGTITVSGSVGLGLAASALTNQANGVINIQGSGGISSSNNNHDLINAGSINVSVTGTTTIATGFDNTGGTVDVQSGTLLIESPHSGISDFWSGGGILNVASGATLQLVGTTITVAGNYSGAGGGQILFQTTIEIGTQATDTAMFNFAPGLFKWQGATFSGPGTLTNAGDVQVVNTSSKSVVGGATVINTGTMTWNFQGSLDTGFISADSTSQIINRGIIHVLNAFLGAHFTNDVGGTLSLEGPGNLTVGGNNTLINNGTIIQNGGSLALGAGGSIGITFGDFVNGAGALFDLQTDAGVTMGDGQIVNEGTFRKSGGTGVSTLGPGFFDHANGTIEVQTGTIAIPLNGDVSSGGVFNVSAGAVLDLSGVSDENTLVGNYSGSGAGHVEFVSGILNMGGRKQGDLNFTTLNFTGGGFLWTGGSLGATNFSGTTTLTNQGLFTIDTGTSPLSLSATLVNSGTLAIRGTSKLQASIPITNQAGGVIDLQSDAKLQQYDADQRRRVRKSAGGGVSTVSAA